MVVPHISRLNSLVNVVTHNTETTPAIQLHHPTTSSSDADTVSELACKDTWDALFSDSESVLLSTELKSNYTARKCCIMHFTG